VKKIWRQFMVAMEKKHHRLTVKFDEDIVAGQDQSGNMQV
jgi:hypothetical protein